MNLTHTHNAEGRKPSLCSFMALSLFQVHCTCPRQGLPSLQRPSLPSFSGAPGPISPPLPPCVSPCPAQPLCQQAYYSRIHHHTPSFLESHWPCCHPQAGLHDFSYSSDVEDASGFLLCLQGEFQTYVWNSSLGICLFPWLPSFPPVPLITMGALVNSQ